MSLQTPQLQEFTNQASQQSWGLWGPVHNISQWETSPFSPMPQRGQARVETGQDSFSPWCTSSRRHGHHPFPTPILPKSSQEHFFRASLIFLGVPEWRRETPASRVTCFEGEIFAHRLYSLFLLALGHPRPRCLGPSSLQLLPCHAWRPRPLPGTRRGSTEPPGQGWRETAFISSAFVFPLQVPGPIMQPPQRGGGAGG